MIVARQLIVNADDFGQSPGVNRGVIRAHEHGIVTSGSLMVRWPSAAEAAVYAREHPELSLGLHLDLGEWICRDGEWMRLYEVVPANDKRIVMEEMFEQLVAFRRLVGRDPTHLDSHQHVHREEPVRSIMLHVASGLGIPLRDFSSAIHYCGDFYGQSANGYPFPQAISVEALTKILQALPQGVTELGCHPGEGNDLNGMYGAERDKETRVLCDPLVRSAIAKLGIKLKSFGAFAAYHLDRG